MKRGRKMQDNTKFILDMFKARKRLTRAQVEQVLEDKKRTANTLQYLEEKGYVKKTKIEHWDYEGDV